VAGKRLQSFLVITILLIYGVGVGTLAADTVRTAAVSAVYAYSTPGDLVVMRGQQALARIPLKYVPKFRGPVWTSNSRYVVSIADNEAATDDGNKRVLVAVDALSGSVRRLPCPYCTTAAPIGGSELLVSEEDPLMPDQFAAMLRFDLGSSELPVELNTKLPALTPALFLAGSAQGVLVVGGDESGFEDYFLLNPNGSAILIGKRNQKLDDAGQVFLRGIGQTAPVEAGNSIPLFAVAADYARQSNHCDDSGDVSLVSPAAGSIVDTDMSPVVPPNLSPGNNAVAMARSIWWGTDNRLHAAMIVGPCDGTSSISAKTGEWVLNTDHWVQVSHDKILTVRDLDEHTRLVAQFEQGFEDGSTLYLENGGHRTKIADGVVDISTPTGARSQEAAAAMTYLDRIGVCATPCQITSRVSFDHPTWGRSTLITTISSTDTPDANIVVLDSSGRVRWQHHAGAWYELKLADPPRDKTGHILIRFNPGRYDGVIILQPAPDGFMSFGTLPVTGDYESRFYSATLINNHGVYEVDKAVNDCNPSCADGTVTHTIFRWNGKDYVKQ
jgi:hypothetical protein